MQLMIDISVESPAALRLAAQFLINHALLRETSEGAAPEVPAGTSDAAAAAMVTRVAMANLADGTGPAPTGAVAAPPAPPAPPAPGNVIPFAPPAPTNAPNALIPGTSSTSAAGLPVGAPVSPVASGVLPVDEYDGHGVPWDARIHQKGRSQKKDGSWKLQKGVAEAVVSAVMQELAPRVRKPSPGAPPAPAVDTSAAAVFGQTPLPAGASPAPVSLPPVPPIPGAPAAPQAPPAPQAPQAPAAPQGDPYRALVGKIIAARAPRKDANGASLPERLTAEEVVQCCLMAGAPSLQALQAMPHLLATVEGNVDAILAQRP